MADLAGRDGVDERALRSGSAVVVRVARCLHRADRVVVAGLHDPVDDLVVAAVSTHRHDQRMSGSRGLPGEIAGVARAFGGAQAHRDLGQPLGQVRVQLLRQPRPVPGAVRVEDDDDPVEGRHGVVVLGHMRR